MAGAARHFGLRLGCLCELAEHAIHLRRRELSPRQSGDSQPLPLGDLLQHVKSRPLGYLTFALNYAAAGNNVVSWHVTNLLIHVAGACALFGIARRAFASYRLAARYGDAAARLGWRSPSCGSCIALYAERHVSLSAARIADGMFYCSRSTRSFAMPRQDEKRGPSSHCYRVSRLVRRKKSPSRHRSWCFGMTGFLRLAVGANCSNVAASFMVCSG